MRQNPAVDVVELTRALQAIDELRRAGVPERKYNLVSTYDRTQLGRQARNKR